MKLSGVVLAAGTSSRLGRPKQLLDVGGRPLLQRVVDVASEAGLDEVVVVLGHEAERIRTALELPARVRVAVNRDYASGQSSSLVCGLGALDPRSEAAVILLGDQPGVTSALIRAVVEAWRAGNAPVARPYFGGVPGHPVVASRAAWPLLGGARGDEGARAALEGAPGDVQRVEVPSEPLADIDTWEDYEALLSD